MENRKTYTRKEITRIPEHKMGEHIKTKEQAEHWFKLLTDEYNPKRKGGGPAIAANGKPIMKKRTFEAARLQFFIDCYTVGKEERPVEKAARDIMDKFN